MFKAEGAENSIKQLKKCEMRLNLDFISIVTVEVQAWDTGLGGRRLGSSSCVLDDRQAAKCAVTVVIENFPKQEFTEEFLLFT